MHKHKNLIKNKLKFRTILTRRKMLSLRRSGKTFLECGTDFHGIGKSMSRSRARQIYIQAERLERMNLI